MCRGELPAAIALANVQSVCEAGEGGNEELKKCPSPSPAFLWIVNVRGRKPRYKKKKHRNVKVCAIT